MISVAVISPRPAAPATDACPANCMSSEWVTSIRSIRAAPAGSAPRPLPPATTAFRRAGRYPWHPAAIHGAHEIMAQVGDNAAKRVGDPRARRHQHLETPSCGSARHGAVRAAEGEQYEIPWIETKRTILRRAGHAGRRHAQNGGGRGTSTPSGSPRRVWKMARISRSRRRPAPISAFRHQACQEPCWRRYRRRCPPMADRPRIGAGALGPTSAVRPRSPARSSRHRHQWSAHRPSAHGSAWRIRSRSRWTGAGSHGSGPHPSTSRPCQRSGWPVGAPPGVGGGDHPDAGPDITVFAASLTTRLAETVPPLPFITSSSPP